MKLSKTDFLVFKDCAKNAWVKVHKPGIYHSKPLSTFDELIMDMGNEVDLLARGLFPGGVLVFDGMKQTSDLVKNNTSVLYQPVFETNNYKTIPDILVLNEDTNLYDLYEVKASNSGENKKQKDELYTLDIAFQYNVLKELNFPIGRLNLVRLNCDYVRGVDLDIFECFKKEDFTERVLEISESVSEDMKLAYSYLARDNEPVGACTCIVRGRSAHCTTFSYCNPEIPEYSIHDIARIGQSKKKLIELVDRNILSIEEIPDDFEFSDKQLNQIFATKTGKPYIDLNEIKNFLSSIQYPISFIDYETYAAAVPRYPGYSPFNQIPFQFSLYVLHEGNTEPIHSEFIFPQNSNPDKSFIQALKDQLPSSGSVLVWYKSFEMTRNKELAERNPEDAAFLENLNERIIDLRDIFDHQHYVHPGFKGRTSIKCVMPVLVPELSYKTLEIQEGATASSIWNQVVTGEYDVEEIKEKVTNLLAYCKLDTWAMYAIWNHLRKMD